MSSAIASIWCKDVIHHLHTTELYQLYLVHAYLINLLNGSSSSYSIYLLNLQKFTQPPWLAHWKIHDPGGLTAAGWSHRAQWWMLANATVTSALLCFLRSGGHFHWWCLAEAMGRRCVKLWWKLQDCTVVIFCFFRFCRMYIHAEGVDAAPGRLICACFCQFDALQQEQRLFDTQKKNNILTVSPTGYSCVHTFCLLYIIMVVSISGSTAMDTWLCCVDKHRTLSDSSAWLMVGFRDRRTMST